MYALWIKRVVDFLFALTLILITAPLLVVCMILIKATSPGPIFYTQERLGYRGRVFRIYKLRTMVNCDRSFHVQERRDDPEVTMLGSILRRSKIDELPQLFNVFSGNMSLVGPRPCLEILHEEMPQWARRRFDVRPGMTGLAQINGNTTLSWPERWVFDTHYAETISAAVDLEILLKTVLVVIFGEKKFGARS